MGSYAVTFADLFHCELPPADAASPARGRRLRDPTHWLAIGTSGCYEFATAVRTLTLDHKSSSSVTKRLHMCFLHPLLIARDRPRLVNRKFGRVAVAVAFQASSVIALVFGVGQRFGFWDTQFSVVTSCFAVPASGEVALVLCVKGLFGFQLREENFR